MEEWLQENELVVICKHCAIKLIATINLKYRYTYFFSSWEFTFYVIHTYTHMQWQQKQVEKYCHKYGLEGEQYHLPPTTKHFVRKNLFTHLLFDDTRKLLFCFVPKVKRCSLIPRPSPAPVFDRLQRAKTEPAELVLFLQFLCS